MTTIDDTNCWPIKQCKKLVALYEDDRITSKEMVENVLDELVKCDPSLWRECLTLVRSSLFARFCVEMDTYFTSNDFMPMPTIIGPPGVLQEHIDAEKQRLRPIYVRISELVDGMARSV